MSTHDVLANPASGCPRALLADQHAFDIRHVGLHGGQLLGRIEVHRSVAAEVAAFFDLALRLGFPIEQVVPASEFDWDDPRLMAANCTSGFNFRSVAGKPSLSMHAFGLAFDVNTRQNPFIRRRATDGGVVETIEPDGASFDPMAPGTLTDGHPLVQFLVDRGWTWGGHWTLVGDGVVDYQHFEKRLDATERDALYERYALPGRR